MSRENLVNAPATTPTLAAALTSGATTLTISAAPATAAPYRILVGSELMLVTAASGTTLTVTRGVEGTTPAAAASGAQVYFPITAQGFNAAVPSADSGESILSAAYAVQATNGTYENTGLSIVLPAAGNYRVTGVVRGSAILSPTASGLGYMVTQLYNATSSAYLTNSETLVFLVNSIAAQTINAAGATAITYDITTAGPTTIQLWVAFTVTTATASSPQLQSDNNGRSRLAYTRRS